MPKKVASAPRSETTKAPGKKRTKAVGKGAEVVVAEPVVAETVRAPSYDEVAERAYALYAARGFREGDAVQDWLRAEESLRGGY